MNLLELIKEIGEEHIQVQGLNPVITGIMYKKKQNVSEIKFLTDQVVPNDIIFDTAKVGLILWIPRTEWNKHQP